MANLRRGRCDKCDCDVYQVQSGSKRCRGCEHGAVFHSEIVVKDSKESKGGRLNVAQKVLEAKQDKDYSAVVQYSIRSLILWIGITLFGVFMIHKGYQQPQFDRGYAQDAYVYTACGFFISFVYANVATMNAQNNEKRQLGRVLRNINFIAMMTFVIQAMDLSPSFLDHAGNPFDVGRILDWVSNCPTLIRLIGEVTHNKDISYQASRLDYLLLTCGFLAVLTKQPYSRIFVTTAVGIFCFLISKLNMMFDRAIRQETPCTLDAPSLLKVKQITMVTWSIFGITFHLQRAKVVSYAMGEVMFCVADIFAKVFVTVIMVNATFEESMGARAKRIGEVAEEIEAQMVQADKLLEKLMPPSIAAAMKAGKATGAEEYASVTVFFSDIPNFQALSSKKSAKELLSVLNNLWNEYDVICKRWGMYKVETIGDAFLGVIGAPERVPDHAVRAANFAVDVIDMVKNFDTGIGEQFVTRIGLNSGPITAGVLGDANPHWCIVGDAVNTASRMESTSQPYRIHISESTYKQINNKGFQLEGPDVMNIKGKGTMNTYWINGRA
ncbi:hypothetical protein HDU78_011634 [Chytriomyces hyalinus]|nr:hypothetical protein HDU78_011634 [Chytriomyces hyalinus]